MKSILKSMLPFVLVGLIFFPQGIFSGTGLEVRTDQLDYLTQIQEVNGDSLGIMHIYSDYPDYKYVHPEKEGITCIDDAARGVVAYLKHYEMTSREKSLRLAKHLLQFIFYMQAEDGGFYNFMWEDYTRNTAGETSHNNGFNWWACRAVWAMGYARYQFNEWNIEPAMQDTIDNRMSRALSKLERQKWTPNQWQNIHGFRIPATHWLLDGWSNMSSELALGLIYYTAVTENTFTDSLARTLSDGFASAQIGDRMSYPYGVVPDGLYSIHQWHAWGSRETQALALAGRLLPDPNPEWEIAARRTADNFYTHMLLTDRITRIQSLPMNHTQINYDMAPVVNGLAELYRLTENEEYARKAALYAAWWFGDNLRSVKMYNQSEGRFYDGVSPDRWNRNSGGETNTEGIMALLDVQSLGNQGTLTHAKVQSCQSVITLEAEDARMISGHPEIKQRDSYGEAMISQSEYVHLSPGDTLRIEFTIQNEYEDHNRYLLEVHQLRGRNVAGISCVIDGTYIGTAAPGQSADKHFWIVTIPESVALSNGDHTLSLTADSAGGTGAVEMIRIHPVVEKKIWRTPDGATLELERHLLEDN